MVAPLELSWSLYTTAPPEVAWAVLSDTDRFNRLAGTGFHFHVDHVDGRVIRRGEISKFGLRIRWAQQPFAYERPRWFVSERAFESGPATLQRARCELEPEGSGTRIRYTLQLFPRSALWWAALRFEASVNLKPALDAVLRACVSAADSRTLLPDPPPPLTPAAEAALEAGLAGVEPPLRSWLGAQIRSAPLRDQARLRPLAAARAAQIPEDQAIAGFLQATRSGALELRWELLCPSCRGAQTTLSALDLAEGAVHCDSCGIDFDQSLPDSLEVVFRAHPKVRDEEVPVDCLTSPVHTPHVFAQALLQPGEETSLALDLPPGGYRVTTDPARRAATLQVGEGPGSATLRIASNELAPGVLRLGAGPSRLLVENRSEQAVWLRVESRWRPPEALTVGALMALPEARQLLPEEALVPGIDIGTFQATALSVELLSGERAHAEQIEAAMRQAGARLVHRAEARRESDTWTGSPAVRLDATVIGVFDEPGAALALGRQLDGDRLLAVGLASGPVVTLSRGAATWPVGPTVDRSLQAMRAVGGARVGLWLRSMDDPATLEALRAGRDRIGRSADSEVAVLRVQHATAPVPFLARRAGSLARVLDGRFRIDGPLASGGMGRVHLATDLRTGEEVVVKQLRSELAEDAWQVQQFFGEARITARLNHPHVVRVLDWGTDPEGNAWIAMERLHGEELAQLLRDGPLSAAKASEIADEALDGLGAAHAVGVVHRDVKPANLFVCRDGHVKVIDFGIAAHIDAEDPYRERGLIIGTPQYLAPEQVELEPLDGRADLYAMGVVLYECLTGALPFEGETAQATAQMRLVSPPPPLPDSVPGPLAGVVARALEVERDARWPTAEAMRGALTRR